MYECKAKKSFNNTHINILFVLQPCHKTPWRISLVIFFLFYIYKCVCETAFASLLLQSLAIHFNWLWTKKWASLPFWATCSCGSINKFCLLVAFVEVTFSFAKKSYTGSSQEIYTWSFIWLCALLSCFSFEDDRKSPYPGFRSYSLFFNYYFFAIGACDSNSLSVH